MELPRKRKMAIKRGIDPKTKNLNKSPSPKT
jgi:hypothetical protein